MYIPKIAKILSVGWKNIAKKNNIKIRVSEVLPLCSFFLDYPNREELYTFFTKEMLKKNYLANNSVWISYAHKEKDIKKYLKNCNRVFKKMSTFIHNRKRFGKFEIRYNSLVRL